jgi:HD-GYP domain-containing protein (c-di-GMP phosphodiesterase class II)
MSEDQFRLFSEHPVVASVILESVNRLGAVAEIVLFHHEYINGKGFPNGLARKQIPLGSRILLVASEYARIMEVWPRDMKKLIGTARRHFNADVWQTFKVTDNPEEIVEEAAEKKILMEANQKYDVEVVSALIKTLRKSKHVLPTFTVELEKLEPGMVLIEDLRMQDGRLLLTKGTKFKSSTVASIRAIGERGLIADRLTVNIPDREEAE